MKVPSLDQINILGHVFEDVYSVESNVMKGYGGKSVLRVTFIGEEKPTSQEQIEMKDMLFPYFDDITFCVPHSEGLCDISSWQK